MANESNKVYSQKREEQKLTGFYEKVLESQNYNEQTRFVLQLLNTKITQLDNETLKMYRIRNTLFISIMLLSGIATVVLGLDLEVKNQYFSQTAIKNIALVLTAITTFLSGLASFWNIQSYWLRNKVMFNKLKELRYEFVFALYEDTKKDSNFIRPFLNRLIGILGDEYWEKMLKNPEFPQKNINNTLPDDKRG